MGDMVNGEWVDDRSTDINSTPTSTYVYFNSLASILAQNLKHLFFGIFSVACSRY